MRWWRQWKDKNWDIKPWPPGSGVIAPRGRVPKFRSWVEAVWADIKTNRWKLYALLTAVLIALLRPWR